MAEYETQEWADDASGGTPINAGALNHMETGIAQASQDANNALTDSGTAKTNASEALEQANNSVKKTGDTMTGPLILGTPLAASSGGTGQTSLQATRNAMGLGNTTGALPVANGGTGLTSNPSMLTNLGSTSAASVLAASPRPGITGTLPVAHGGTGATSASAACQNLITGQSIWPSSLELGGRNSPGSGNGGFIDFHFNGSAADNTSRIIEDASGQIDINGIKFPNARPEATLSSLGVWMGAGTVGNGSSAGWHQVWAQDQFRSKFGGRQPTDCTIYFQDHVGANSTIVYDAMVDGSNTVWLRSRTDSGAYTGAVSFRFLVVAASNK